MRSSTTGNPRQRRTENKTIPYSVRYPSAQEEGERIKVRGDR